VRVSSPPGEEAGAQDVGVSQVARSSGRARRGGWKAAAVVPLEDGSEHRWAVEPRPEQSRSRRGRSGRLSGRRRRCKSWMGVVTQRPARGCRPRERARPSRRNRELARAGPGARRRVARSLRGRPPRRRSGRKVRVPTAAVRDASSRAPLRRPERRCKPPSCHARHPLGHALRSGSIQNAFWAAVRGGTCDTTTRPWPGSRKLSISTRRSCSLAGRQPRAGLCVTTPIQDYAIVGDGRSAA